IILGQIQRLNQSESELQAPQEWSFIISFSLLDVTFQMSTQRGGALWLGARSFYSVLQVETRQRQHLS
ncbi:unnamed protein product, partial [Rangifer tarandus platyrhynchus]